MNLQVQPITKCTLSMLLVASAALASGCATDSGTRSAAASADPAAEGEYLSASDARKDPERIICRRHKPTGSRISEKICMTARQWQQASDDSRSVLDKAHRAPQAGVDQ